MIYDMMDTFKNEDSIRTIGFGIAANQIGYTKRYILIAPTLNSKEVKVLANPVIVNHGKDIIALPEGCLSKPGNIKEIRRYQVIDVEYEDETWTKRKETFKGISARIIQHELNHLDGLDCLENRI
jgi:peptide deformylase